MYYAVALPLFHRYFFPLLRRLISHRWPFPLDQPKEVKFLAFLQNAALKAEKELVTARDSEALENRIYDNFFSVIGEVKRRGLSSETSF